MGGLLAHVKVERQKQELLPDEEEWVHEQKQEQELQEEEQELGISFAP